MRRLPFGGIVVFGALLWGASSLSAQTARDTVHRATCDNRMATSLETEADRNQFRKSVARAIADTLRQCGARLVAPAPVPPDTTTKPPAAPVASFEVVCALVTCAFDARASTGPKISYAWDCNVSPACSPGNVATFAFTYPHEGPRTPVLTVTDSLGRKSTASKTVQVPGIPDTVPPDTTTPPDTVTPPPDDTTKTPKPAALPKGEPVVSFAKATRVDTVAAPEDLQLALNAAQPGDSLILRGAWTGNFILPTRPCGAGITIIGTFSSVPAGRMTPSKAAALSMGKVISPNNAPAIKTTNPTCGWRIAALEITGTLPQTSVQYGLLALGDGGWKDGGDTQTDSTKVPRDFLVDRVYIHGSATLNSTRCLALNSANTIIRDSWISECHASGFDSQAINGWNGPGPYLIENNYLEGAGENVMFGGADPGIVGMVPCDITMRRNHVYKPLSWKGGPWSIKNLFELKTACRMLIEGNVFENVWPAAQEGMAIVIKANANGCTCTWLGTRDITFRYNIVRNAAIGLNLQAWDDSYGWSGGVHVQRFKSEHNLFENIGAEGETRALMMPTHDLADVELAHNTMIQAPGIPFGLTAKLAYSFGAAKRVRWRDNVLTTASGYGFHNSDNGAVHSAALNAFAGSTWTFDRNVVGGMLAEYIPLNPPGSWYPSTVAGIGLAPDYSLLPTSPYKGKGQGGTDPGADIPELQKRTAGVVVAP